MDETLNAVALNCAKELDQFSACVKENPDSWDQKCVEYQASLAKCSEKQYDQLDMRDESYWIPQCPFEES